MQTRYTIIHFSTGTLEQLLKANYSFFIDHIATALNKLLEYKVTREGKINISLGKNDFPAHLSSNEIKVDWMKNFQIIIEYNEEDRKVLAIHDYYFSQTSENNAYRVSMDNLYLYTGKYESEVCPIRLYQSIVYGLLTEIAMHNPGNPDLYTKGLLLADHLHKHPPKETYKITKKIPMTEQEIIFSLLKNNVDIVNNIKKHITPIPQINFDDFDKENMLHIMQECGSFEIVGPRIEKLAQLALQTLDKTEEIFNLPEVDLKATEDINDFNGFKNIHEQTKEIVSKENKGTALNQKGFFYKPYNPRIPSNIDASVLNDYYHQGLAILKCLYRQIAISLNVDINNLSDYTNDKQSILSLKHYPKMNSGDIGIQAHSDYSLLTLVVSNQQGLEIQRGDQWIAAPHEPLLRFYVNVGDWLLFQLNNSSFKSGIHRVPSIDKEKYSAILFYLPPLNEIRKTPNGEMTAYRDFLFSDKSAYISKDKNIDNSDPTSTPVIKQRI